MKKMLIYLYRWFSGKCTVCGNRKTDWRGTSVCRIHDLI